MSNYPVFGESYSSINQITRFIWLARLGALMILLLIYSLGKILHHYDWFPSFIISIGAVYLIIISLTEKKAYFSATPIVIYGNGIQMYSPPIHRLFGQDGFVQRSEIASIEVRRSPVLIERVATGRSVKYIHWRDVPSEILIRSTSGKRFRTGNKHPLKISEMFEIITTEWGFLIMDSYGGQIDKIEFEPGREEPA